MKAHRSIIFIIGLFLLNTIIAKAQDSIRFIPASDTTVGIPITKTEFRKKVSGYLALMSDWTKFTPEQYVDMVRVNNTITDMDLNQESHYRMYAEVFTVMYIKPIGIALNAKPMKGMSMYSKKYNIWMGDRPFGNSNSRYRIGILK